MNEFEELLEEKSKEKHKKEKKQKKEKKKRERDDDGARDGGEERKRTKKEEKGEKKKRDGESKDEKKNATTNKREIHTLFFGQMPFDTKAKDIEPWLKANLNRQGCGRDIGQIRMAGGDGEGTPGKQKKFKGFAFVDFTTAKAAKKAMKLHDTLFRGRPVTVERCERKTYQEPKSVRRAKKEEGKEVNTKEEGKTKREGLKVLTAPDDVEVVIKHVCENSEGTLRESDFDDRLKSFLGLLPRDVCEKAANEIRKFTTNKNKKEVKNKGAFYMGIVRKISNACWQKKAAKDSMVEKDGGELR
jgi:RNA recognition motif-containing protein